MKPAILVVDDDPAMCYGLCRMLERSGYEVFTARQGVEAAGILQSHADRIHVIVLDMVMPEMGGLDLMRHLVNVHTIPVAVVGMSGLFEENHDEFYGVGSDPIVSASSFLAKPLSYAHLTIEVQRALELAQRKRSAIKADATTSLEPRLEGMERQLGELLQRTSFWRSLGMDLLRLILFAVAVAAALGLGITDLLRDIFT